MKIKTSELTGAALGWAVAQCERAKLSQASLAYQLRTHGAVVLTHGGRYVPYENWSQGGPIIERNLIQINPSISSSAWGACNPSKGQCVWMWADTPLIAAMRCLVSAKFGDEVEIPDALVR